MGSATRQRPLGRRPRNIAGVFSKRSPRAISCRPPLSWQAPRRFQRRQPRREGNSISALIQRVREWTPAVRGSLVLVICAGALACAAFLPPITQPQAYHQFADQRQFFGLPHAFDVLSNATFLIAGLLGLWFVVKAGKTLDAGSAGPWQLSSWDSYSPPSARRITTSRRTTSAWFSIACRSRSSWPDAALQYWPTASAARRHGRSLRL